MSKNLSKKINKKCKTTTYIQNRRADMRSSVSILTGAQAIPGHRK